MYTDGDNVYDHESIEKQYTFNAFLYIYYLTEFVEQVKKKSVIKHNTDRCVHNKNLINNILYTEKY